MTHHRGNVPARIDQRLLHRDRRVESHGFVRVPDRVGRVATISKTKFVAFGDSITVGVVATFNPRAARHTCCATCRTTPILPVAAPAGGALRRRPSAW